MTQYTNLHRRIRAISQPTSAMNGGKVITLRAMVASDGVAPCEARATASVPTVESSKKEPSWSYTTASGTACSPTSALTIG